MFNLYIDETFVCAYIESFANTGCFFKIFQTFWIAYVKIALFNNCGRKKKIFEKAVSKEKTGYLVRWSCGARVVWSGSNSER